MNLHKIMLCMMTYCMIFSHGIIDASLGNKKIIIPSFRFMDTDDHSDHEIAPAQQISLFDTIKKTAWVSSDRTSDNLGDVEHTQDYLINYDYDPDKNIIEHNLAPAEYIIDSKGDGNCGYRSFLGSIFINANQSDNASLLVHLNQLLDAQYIQLFEKYDTQYNLHKHDAAVAIKQYLTEQLQKLSEYTDLQEIHDHLNTEYAFVYYMIMFLRYLIADNIAQLNAHTITSIAKHTGDFISDQDQELFTQASELELLLADALQADNTTLPQYLEQIVTWKDELTLDQSRLLAQATGISLYTISQHNQYQPLAISAAQPAHGIATILYTDNHYRIFVPTIQDPADLVQYFEKEKLEEEALNFLPQSDKKITLYEKLTKILFGPAVPQDFSPSIKAEKIRPDIGIEIDSVDAMLITTIVVLSAMLYMKNSK